MKKVLTQFNCRLRQPMLPLLVLVVMSIPTTAVAGDVLFVSDSETDANNIPEVLSGRDATEETAHPTITGARFREAANANFHDVTIVSNDYEVTGGTFGAADGTNPTLAGDLTGYCSVFWSASGPHEPLGIRPYPADTGRLDNGGLEDTAATFSDNVAGAPGYMRLFPGDTELSGWEVDSPVVWGRDPNVDGALPSEGNAFVDLSGIGDEFDGRIRQERPTREGVTYEFSIDRRGDGSVVSFNGVDAVLTPGATSGDWTTYTAEYTANSATTTVVVYDDGSNTTGIVFVDNMSFLPEPAHVPGLGADGGLHTDAAVFDNLSDYVDAGGYVFITGHDAIAHPLDPLLIEFVGGAMASAGQQINPNHSPVANIVTALTSGPVPVIGASPSGGGINPVNMVQDQDYLAMITDPNVTVLVTDAAVGTTPPAAAWTVRHPGGAANDFSNGHIAFVSNGVFFYETDQEDMSMMPVKETLSDGQDPSWQTTIAYTGALTNFAHNACTEPELPVLDDVSGRGKGDKVNLIWTDNGADSYDVFRSSTAIGPYALIGNTANNVYVDSPVTPGETYYYVVQGVFGGENSADSNVAEVVVPAGRRR